METKTDFDLRMERIQSLLNSITRSEVQSIYSALSSTKMETPYLEQARESALDKFYDIFNLMGVH